MLFKQFYLGCLAHASYLIGEGGEAAVVDPQRDVDQYIEEAARQGLRIKYVIETHLHADFVSGHHELAARTGAQIVIGAEAKAVFPHLPVRDGNSVRLGSIELRAVETPGHTPESICWLLVDGGRPAKVLTGDTLFVGDVGRPDLAGGRGYTPQMMASMMYDSIHKKLLALPDDVEVWPAHGAGSACGRNISSETSSTIGAQRRTNYALQPMPREEFVKLMTTDMPSAPPYFSRDAEINRRGARSLAEVTASPSPLPPDSVREEINRGAILLDVRDPVAFGAQHIAGAINIGLGGQFASWCGTLLPAEAPIVVSADADKRANEAVMRLARVGIESAVGYVTSSEGFDRASLPQIKPTELHEHGYRVLDVRRPPEYAMGHVPGAQHIPLDELPRRSGEVRRGEPLAVICASGYRSSIASSLLMREGFTDVMNVVGGTGAWMRAGFGVE